MTTAVGWAPIIKSEKRDDGTLVITGKAADSSVDRDYQIADPAWLDKAMGQWYGEPDGGNIREQHDGHRAVGTAVEYRKGDDGGHYLTAEIVDPNTVRKIERRVLKGFSWSARNARVTVDKAAKGGRIVDGQIYEVSVVDRPANPECRFTIAKADGPDGNLELVDEPELEVIEKGDDEPRFTPSDLANLLKSMGKTQPAVQEPDAEDVTVPDVTVSKSDDGECPKCGADVDDSAKYCANCGQNLTRGKDDGGQSGDKSKADAVDLAPMWGDELHKAVSVDKRKEYADKGIAMPNGDFPIPDEAHLRSAIGHLGGYTGDKSKAKAHIIKRARALGKTNLLPDEWGVAKAFDAVDALTQRLTDAGVDLSKVDAEAEEGADISDSKTAIAAIARLIIAEAQELAEGHLCEIDDIQMLCAAACALRCFIDQEADEIASHAAPTESAMKTDKPDVPTEPGTSTTDTIDKSTTEAAPEGELTKTDLSEMLEAAIAKARKPLEDELALVKADLAKVLETPRPDGPARTRTTTHTAHATKADQLRTEIAYCDTQIHLTSGDLQKGYRQRRDDATAELAKLDGAAA